MQKPSKQANEHHAACVEGRACHRDCAAWEPPKRSGRGGARRLADGPLVLDSRRVRGRILHTAPLVPPGQKTPPAAPPLWEHIVDWGAVAHHRELGVEIVTRMGTRTLLGLPLPRLDGPPRDAIGLDRWTNDDSPEAAKLEEALAASERARQARVLETNVDKRVRRIGDALRGAFAGVAAHPAGAPPPPTPKTRARPPSARMQELLDLVLGEAGPGPRTSASPPVPAPPDVCARPDGSRWDDGHVVSWMCCTMAGLVYALGLVLLGRDRDPVSEHALGRMLPGEPVRETRAPFASPAHVLAVAAAPLPGLGGGSCPWPSDDPRMAKRTWSKPGEMRVSSAFHGTEHVRGEAAVNRALTAAAAVRRAALAPHERAAVDVLADKDLTRDEKVLRLREIEARRRDSRPTDELTSQWFLLPLQLDSSALHAATADISDGQLLQAARAAAKRLGVAVDRVSRAGDRLAPLAPKRPTSKRADRHVEAYLPGGEA